MNAGNFNRLLKPLVFISVSSLAILTIIRGVLGIPTPYLHNYMENVMLANSWGLAAGLGLYRASMLNEVPLFIATYPPIFYFIVAAGIKIWGITYIPGRIVSFFALIGCAVLIALISRRRGVSKFSSVLAAFLFLGAWPIYLWSRFLRVDSPAVFFELAAVYSIAGGKYSKRRAALFVIFALLAGYTKQTAFGIVFGSLLIMIFYSDNHWRRRGIFLASVYAISAILAFALIEIYTGWGFHKFVIETNMMGLSFDLFLQMTGALISDPVSIALISMSVIAIATEKQDRWLTPFVGIPLLLALATIGKMGSGPNYFIETIAVCSVASGVFIDRIKKPDQRSMKTALTFLLIFFSVACAGYLRWGSVKSLLNDAKYFKSPDTANTCIRFTNLMRNTLPPGSLVLAQYSDLPLFAGCVPAMSDPLTMAMLVDRGAWNPAPVVTAIREKKIALVLTLEEITTDKPMRYMPQEVAKAIKENYSKQPNLWIGYELYIPNR